MRFVILRHQLPAAHPRAGTHYDLMLEHQGRLLTWALAEPLAAGSSSPAEPLADHRLEYLDYEGPVSGGRGHVTRWDRGGLELCHLGPDRVEAVLNGEQINGTLVLQRVRDGWTARLEGVEGDRA